MSGPQHPQVTARLEEAKGRLPAAIRPGEDAKAVLPAGVYPARPWASRRLGLPRDVAVGQVALRAFAYLRAFAFQTTAISPSAARPASMHRHDALAGANTSRQDKARISLVHQEDQLAGRLSLAWHVAAYRLRHAPCARHGVDLATLGD